jgi:hypothetical protein
MATETGRRTLRQRQILDELIRKRGLLGGEYGLFLVAGEGKFFLATSPWAEIEESSGFVLDKRGRVFMFWLGWDAERQGPPEGRVTRRLTWPNACAGLATYDPLG